MAKSRSILCVIAFLAAMCAVATALWWKQLTPNSKATHFVYDAYSYRKDPTAAQALEFDVNQTVNASGTSLAPNAS